MNEIELNEARVALLRSAIDRVAEGNVSAFGRKLGYKDGAFIRQMLSGNRPVSEKTIRSIESLPGLTGWFKRAEALAPNSPNTAKETAFLAESVPVVPFHSGTSPVSPETANVPEVPQYSLDKNDFRPVYVIEWPQGGMPESVWDGEKLVGATEKFAVLATKDRRAFIVPVPDDSMFPRLMPGEYVLVQPGREPDLEDTVFLRLRSGDTMLRRLLSRRDNHVRLGAWNDTAVQSFREDEISWIYTVAHAVPAWMISQR